jgi:hypothetical protein
LRVAEEVIGVVSVAELLPVGKEEAEGSVVVGFVIAVVVVG